MFRDRSVASPELLYDPALGSARRVWYGGFAGFSAGFAVRSANATNLKDHHDCHCM